MDEVTLREQRELRDTVGDWLNKLTDDEWKPFTVTETGYRPFTANDEALSKLIGGDGCVEMRFGVCVYDAECPDNEERSLVIWLEGTGLGFQSLHNIRERVRPQWLNAFQTDGHCHGSPTVKHEDDYSVVLEPDVWLKLTNKGVKAKQAILNGDVETTLKRICRHGEFANEPEAERRLNVLPTEPASDATELPSVPNHSDNSPGTPDGVPGELVTTPADSTGTQVKTATGESAPAKNEPEAECQLPAAPTEPASDATELPSVPNHSDDSTGTPDGVPDELGTATADSTGPVGDQPDPTGTEESEAGDRDSKPDEEIVQASRGTKRMILVALFEKSSWTYVDRISSPEIAKWTEGKTGEVKDQTIRVHTPWLKDHDFIDGSIEGGNSGFWLLPKGKKLARKLAKT